MNIRQKKTLGFLLCLVALLVVLLVAVRAVNKNKAAEKAAESASSADAVTATGVEYTKLAYSNQTATLSFEKDEAGQWYWADDPDFPLDNDYLAKITNTISGLSPQQTITDGDTLEAYGLDKPSVTLTATASDGSETTFALGNEAAGGSGSYYLLINGDESTVYVVDGSLHTELSNGIYAMMKLPELPVLSQEQISSISIGGAVQTTLTADAEPAKQSASSSSSAGASSSAKPTVTVTWKASGQDVTAYDTTTSLVSEVCAMTISACEDFKPTDDAVSLCGFDAPRAVLKVSYTDQNGSSQTLALTIANATADGKGCYVRLDGDTTIYSMSNGALQAILSVADSGIHA